MRIALPGALAASLLLVAAGCTSGSDEATGTNEDAVICTVDGDPTKPCKGSPPRRPIPDVTYLVVTTTETSAHLSFLTQNGATSPEVSIGKGFAPTTPAIATQVEDAPSVSHDFDFANLPPCQELWYTIAWDGEVRASGRFSLTPPTVTFDTSRIAYDHLQVHAHSSVPVALSLHIHQAQAIPTDADWTAAMSDPGGLDHWYSFSLNGPRYEIVSNTCPHTTLPPVVVEDWPQTFGAQYQAAITGVDAPGDVTTTWSDESEVQGIAHDDRGNWLISNMHHIYKVPATARLDWSSSALPGTGDIPGDLFAAGYTHIGDLDFSGGYVFAPLEDGDTSKDPYLLVFDRDLKLVLRQKIAKGATFEVPWVAVNPIDGLLYTSIFQIDGTAGHGIRRFYISRDASGKPTYVSPVDEIFPVTNGARMAIHRVQGGVFSPMGHLYLVDDADADDGGQGIYGFAIAAGAAQYRAYQFIDYKPGSHGGIGGFEELEGLDLWDMSDGRAPGVGGQLHVLMGEAGSDYWLKHYEVRNPDGTASPAGVWAL